MQRQNLVGANGNEDFVPCRDCERRFLRVFHEVYDRRGGRASRNGYANVGVFSGPLVETQDQTVAVFCFFHGGQDDVLRRRRDE